MWTMLQTDKQIDATNITNASWYLRIPVEKQNCIVDFQPHITHDSFK